MPDLSIYNLYTLTLLGCMALIGYYAGHGARKLRLPSIIGYMFLGVILGPSLFNLVNDEALHSLAFITEVALGYVAFTIGSELSLASLKRLGMGIVVIIFSESLLAFAVVTVAVWMYTGDLPLALIFGAMAPASAPAGTVSVIQEYKAKGDLTKALYAVVGFDDGLAILIFGFAAAIARSLLIQEATGTAGSIMSSMVEPTKEIVLSIVVGAVIGFIFSYLIKKRHTPKDVLILSFATIMIATGLSVRWHLSLILTNMVVGFVLVNLRREAMVHRVTQPLLDIMPLQFVLFFTLAGAHLELKALPALGLLGVIYIIGRSTGLVTGARIGAILGRMKNENIKKYLGMGILSQAGVAIGLSLIINHEFGLLSEEYGIPHAATIGATVITTITATCIFFEIIGPILTKIALDKAGEIGKAK